MPPEDDVRHRLLSLPLLSTLLALGCASGGASTSAGSASAASAASSSPASPAAADARIAQLRRSFDCEVGGSGVELCLAKDGMLGTLTRKRLEPVVLSTGTIYLRSVYRDRDWIYHDHVVVRIGDQELASEPQGANSASVTRREVRRNGRDSRGRNYEDYVAETVSYRGRSDGGIVEAIAKSGRAPVHVRFTGGPRQFEKALSDDERKLFAEAWELAALFRERAR